MASFKKQDKKSKSNHKDAYRTREERFSDPKPTPKIEAKIDRKSHRKQGEGGSGAVKQSDRKVPKQSPNTQPKQTYATEVKKASPPKVTQPVVDNLSESYQESSASYQESNASSLRNANTHIRERQPDDNFITARDICEIQLEESYSAPVKTATVTINSNGNSGGVVNQEIERVKTKAARIPPWKPTEDEKLLTLYASSKGNWKRIAKCFANRDEKEIKARFKKIKFNQKRTEGRWSKEEVEELMKYHRMYKTRYEMISRKLKNRTPQQVKDKIREIKKSDLRNSKNVSQPVALKKNAMMSYKTENIDTG